MSISSCSDVSSISSLSTEINYDFEEENEKRKAKKYHDKFLESPQNFFSLQDPNNEITVSLKRNAKYIGKASLDSLEKPTNICSLSEVEIDSLIDRMVTHEMLEGYKPGVKVLFQLLKNDYSLVTQINRNKPICLRGAIHSKEKTERFILEYFPNNGFLLTLNNSFFRKNYSKFFQYSFPLADSQQARVIRISPNNQISQSRQGHVVEYLANERDIYLLIAASLLSKHDPNNPHKSSSNFASCHQIISYTKNTTTTSTTSQASTSHLERTNSNLHRRLEGLSLDFSSLGSRSSSFCSLSPQLSPRADYTQFDVLIMEEAFGDLLEIISKANAFQIIFSEKTKKHLVLELFKISAELTNMRLVHNNIEPSNFLIYPNGEPNNDDINTLLQNCTLKICGYSVAKRSGEEYLNEAFNAPCASFDVLKSYHPTSPKNEKAEQHTNGFSIGVIAWYLLFDKKVPWFNCLQEPVLNGVYEKAHEIYIETLRRLKHSNTRWGKFFFNVFNQDPTKRYSAQEALEEVTSLLKDSEKFEEIHRNFNLPANFDFDSD